MQQAFMTSTDNTYSLGTNWNLMSFSLSSSAKVAMATGCHGNWITSIVVKVKLHTSGRIS